MCWNRTHNFRDRLEFRKVCAPPQAKISSKDWRHEESLPPKKFNSVQSAGKVRQRSFETCTDILLGRDTINAEYYSNLNLNYLQEARWQTLKKIIFPCDNARPHTVNLTMVALSSMDGEIIAHPPYSLYLALSDFHLFGLLTSNDQLIYDVRQCLSLGCTYLFML